MNTKVYNFAFIKTLTTADVDPKVSNQHELHGVKNLESIFGVIKDSRKQRYEAYIRIGHQGTPYPINITWYHPYYFTA